MKNIPYLGNATEYFVRTTFNYSGILKKIFRGVMNGRGYRGSPHPSLHLPDFVLVCCISHNLLPTRSNSTCIFSIKEFCLVPVNIRDIVNVSCLRLQQFATQHKRCQRYFSCLAAIIQNSTGPLMHCKDCLNPQYFLPSIVKYRQLVVVAIL